MSFMNPKELHSLYDVIREKEAFPADVIQGHFGRKHQFTTRTIDLDVIEDTETIGIFVSPDQQAVATEGDDYGTRIFYPAYWKDKASVPINSLMDRQAGQDFMPQSLEGNIARELNKRITKLDAKRNRLYEWACSQLLLKGKYTAQSELHKPIEINLFRPEATTAAELNSDQSHTADLTTINANGGVGLRAWDSTGGTNPLSPIDDMQQMMDVVWEPIDAIYIGEKAWKYLKQDPEFINTIDSTLTSMSTLVAELLPKQRNKRGLKLLGMLGTVPIWNYSATYKDLAGNSVRYFDETYVVMVPSSQYGVQCFGAIQHGDANLLPLEIFWNSWTTDEDGIPWVQGQSAPAFIHTKTESTLAWKVVS